MEPYYQNRIPEVDNNKPFKSNLARLEIRCHNEARVMAEFKVFLYTRLS